MYVMLVPIKYSVGLRQRTNELDKSKLPAKSEVQQTFRALVLRQSKRPARRASCIGSSYCGY